MKKWSASFSLAMPVRSQPNDGFIEGGEIDMDGLIKFYEELGVDAASDPVAIVISYHMGAEKMGEYQREEFMNGFKKLGCSSISELKGMLDQLRG